MMMMFGSQLLLPLFLQNVRGLSPLATGLLMAPEAIATAIMMPIAGRLLDKVGARPLAIPGLFGLAFAYWQLAAIDPDTLGSRRSPRSWCLRGASQGMMMLPLMTVAMDRIAPARMSRATVLATVIRQIAGAFGAASAASLLLMRQQHHQATLVQTVTPDATAVVSSLGSMTVRLLEQGVAAGASATIALGAAQRPHEAGGQRPRLRRLFLDLRVHFTADAGAGPDGAAPPPAPLTPDLTSAPLLRAGHHVHTAMTDTG